MNRTTASDDVAGRTRGRTPAATEGPRNDERTADAELGTDDDGGRRGMRRPLFERSLPQPADRHE